MKVTKRRSIKAGPMTLTAIYARCIYRGDCRLWQGGLSRQGYPSIYTPALFASGHHTGCQSGRGLVWSLKHGKPGEGVITTTCGDKLCLAQSHLIDISRTELGRIAAERGSYKSAQHVTARLANSRKAAKLTLESARNVRVRVAAGETTATVAADLGVSVRHVRDVVRGAAWAERMAPNASVFWQAAS